MFLWLDVNEGDVLLKLAGLVLVCNMESFWGPLILKGSFIWDVCRTALHDFKIIQSSEENDNHPSHMVHVYSLYLQYAPNPWSQ